MGPSVEIIRNYFVELGLTTEIADLYSALHANGPQTISELARNSNVERTRIYRLLELLRKSGLVEVETKYKRSIVSSAPLSNLQILIDQKRETLSQLRADLPKIQNLLTPSPSSSPTTRVQYYRGAPGLRQMLWNELRATTGIMSYSYQILDEGVGRPFMKNWVVEFERRNLDKKILFNDSYVESWHNRHGNRIKGFEYHFIEPSILDVAHTCYVYDDVTCYLSWKDGEIFGVEIYNQNIADVQRQFLNLVWTKSRPETRF